MPRKVLPRFLKIWFFENHIFFILKYFFNSKDVGQPLRVPTYFDTSNNQLSCNNVNNNCDDKVKYLDHDVWEFTSDMTVNFNDKECIQMESDHSFVDTNCDTYQRLVCVLDCCKYLNTLYRLH